MLQPHSNATGSLQPDFTPPIIEDRCDEMAEAMRDIAAITGGVNADQLFYAGFSDEEIKTFGGKAARIAALRSRLPIKTSRMRGAL